MRLVFDLLRPLSYNSAAIRRAYSESATSFNSSRYCFFDMPRLRASNESVDAERGLIEIELPTGADAIVLNISVDYKEEWSIDGRSDGGFTGQ